MSRIIIFILFFLFPLIGRAQEVNHQCPDDMIPAVEVTFYCNEVSKFKTTLYVLGVSDLKKDVDYHLTNKLGEPQGIEMVYDFDYLSWKVINGSSGAGCFVKPKTNVLFVYN